MAANPVLAQLQLQLDSASPIQLLLTAESGAHGVDPSQQAAMASTAVAVSLGVTPSNFDSGTATALMSMVQTKLFSLRTLCAGPSLAIPNGNFYSWFLA
jgi:hypothetical protein